MITGLTSPGDDVDVLRQQYDRLCDVMTRAAETDPAAAERVLVELQLLSERILALEAAAGGMGTPATAAGGAAPAAAPAGEAAPPAPAAEAAPAAGAARVVAFRVTPGTDAEGKATARTTSWRLDAPTSPPSPRAEPTAKTPAEPPVAPARPAPPAPARATPPAPPHGAAAPARPAASTAAASMAAPAEAAPGAGPVTPASPTMFSAAIRSWLERHREVGVAPEGSGPTPPAGTPPGPETRAKPGQARIEAEKPAPTRAERAQPSSARPSATAQGRPVRVAAANRPPGAQAQPVARREPREMARIAAAIEQQAAQIERILALSVDHQAALERLEAQIQAELRAPAPVAAPDSRIPELHAAVEEQRQRLTALAKTIHNLAQWLAAERAGPKR